MGSCNGLLRWHNPWSTWKLTIGVMSLGIILALIPFKYVFIPSILYAYIDHFLPPGSVIKDLINSVPYADDLAYQFITEYDQDTV